MPPATAAAAYPGGEPALDENALSEAWADLGASFGAGATDHRMAELGRRVLLHDASTTLGTQHAIVDRVARCALDETHRAARRRIRRGRMILQRDLDPAAAGTHVAGAVGDALRRSRVEDAWLAGHLFALTTSFES
jgi:hypothetical protein